MPLRLWLFQKMSGLSRRGLLNFVPDALFLRLQYYLKLGRRLNLAQPSLYNEKLQWLKLHDHRPEYCTYVDKLAVRDYVAAKAGEKYLIPLIAACERVDQIDWDALPQRFVIKCTHGSSSNIICADKSQLDVAAAKSKLEGWMQRNWFWLSREWPYKNVRPRIIVEKFMGGADGSVPYDYKLMCFDGEPRYIVVDADRYTGHTRNYYDTSWVKQPMRNRHPNCAHEIPRPPQLEEMLDVARKLSQGIPHVRIDLYVVDGAVYFGEMTFFHGFGMEVFEPRAFEQHMGDLISLPGKENH